MRACPVQGTPPDHVHQAIQCTHTAFRSLDHVGIRIGHFGAQQHGLLTPCLRFEAEGHPPTTQDSVLAVANFARWAQRPTGFQYKVSESALYIIILLV